MATSPSVILVCERGVERHERQAIKTLLSQWGLDWIEPARKLRPGESIRDKARSIRGRSWLFFNPRLPNSRKPFSDAGWPALSEEALHARRSGFGKIFLLGSSPAVFPEELREFHLSDWPGPNAADELNDLRAELIGRTQSERTPPAVVAYSPGTRIANKRCFHSEQALDLDQHLWTVILGDNGTGKTTLLQHIGEEHGDCIGYGAGRGMRLAQLSKADTHPCASLMNDGAALADPEEWLLQTDYAHKSGDDAAGERLAKVKQILIDLLPDVRSIDFRVNGNTMAVCETPYGLVPMRELSFGYRTALTWIVDFARRLFERYPDSPNPLAERAVVLVDEIDLHLHPKWQRQLIDLLRRTFPRAQFIVTAHSPLIVQAATGAKIVLLRREGDSAIIDTELDHIREWRIDQILASELFEHQPTHAPRVEALLAERVSLLGKAVLVDADERRVVEIDALLDELPTSANPEDQRALDLIRQTANLLRAEAGHR